ncbi:YveK family protein [Lactobacillus corticis]|uniref:Capsular polysaccharide biosynthesis protein CpsC n=1 Tax=Lactobacillus corticis TaxID=2201249 RepID=A0A916QIQ0_9LACO|nr:Wzz/FepE/Etk N-terminal domain-containing protein [Lactobacillus corticis]GFZ26178.1 exopolysaccharide biosynthesis protein [Lactobacillus corticis]
MNTENTIDLRRLLTLLKEHVLSIVLWTVGLGLLAWGYTEIAITPKYTASTQVLVNQKTNKNDAGQAYQAQQAGIQVITTYKDLIKNDVILSDTKSELAHPTKLVKKAQPAKYKTLSDGTKKLVKKATKAVYEQSGKAYNVSKATLAKEISVSSNQNSQVFSINVVDTNPERAKAIANTTAKVFKKKIAQIMSVENVTIVARAVAPTRPSSPRVKLYVAVGLLAGFVISILIIVLRELFDVTVRDDTFMTQEMGLTNLGVVSHIELEDSVRNMSALKPKRSSKHRV